MRLFANVAEAGLGAAVAARAERMSPRLGQSKYFFGFWLTLPRFKMASVIVRADRRSYEGPAYLIVVGNAQYNGGGMKVSPRSYPGDGVLDVLVFKGPKSDSFTMIPKVYRGEHVPHDHVEEFRVKRELVIEADRPLPIEADGEVLGATPATFEVIPHPIRLKL
jgi:diacylglycerol kinase family enzyme